MRETSVSCICWQPKLSILWSYQNMERTSPLRFSRRDGQKNIYGTSNSESGWTSYTPERCSFVGSSDYRKFRQVSGLPGRLKKPIRVSGVIPTSGVPTKVESSDCREFRPKSGLPTDLIKNSIRIWPFDSDPNCSKLAGNLKNKVWRGSILG